MRRLSHICTKHYIHICASIPNTFQLCIPIHAYSHITKSQQQYTTISIGNLIFVCDFFEFYGHLKMATSYILTYYLLPGYSSLRYASARCGLLLPLSCWCVPLNLVRCTVVRAFRCAVLADIIFLLVRFFFKCLIAEFFSAQQHF